MTGRILLLDDSPIWGGGEQVLKDYADSLKGHYRVLVRPAAAPEPLSKIPCERTFRLRFPTYPARMSKKMTQLRTLLPSLLFAGRLRRIIRSERVDLILANTYYSLIPLLLARVRSPILWICHTRDIPGNSASRRLIAQAAHVIAVSQAIYRHLDFIPAHKMTLLPNGVECEDPPVRDSSWRIRLGWQDRRVLGFVGRLAPVKNLPALIEAFVQVRRQEREPLGLLLSGDGPQRGELQQMVCRLHADRDVAFTGWLENPRPVMADLDGLVLPSENEGLGLALLEAMAAGVPVMGANVGGISEIIEDGVTGILAASPRASDLAGAIRRLARVNRESSIAQAGRERVRSRFNLATQREKFLEIVESLLKESSPR